MLTKRQTSCYRLVSAKPGHGEQADLHGHFRKVTIFPYLADLWQLATAFVLIITTLQPAKPPSLTTPEFEQWLEQIIINYTIYMHQDARLLPISYTYIKTTL